MAVSVASEVTELTAEQLEPLLDTGVSCLAIMVPLPKETLIALNNKCRKVGAAFIYTVTMGVFSQVFSDFGEAFVCSDKDGNPPVTFQIESIFQEGENVVVRVLEDHGCHSLETGDVVSFALLKGAEGSLDATKHYKVNVTGPFIFEIHGETVKDSDSQQGYITQVKQPINNKLND
jgi:ubiquitin-activating enzyme E1